MPDTQVAGQVCAAPGSCPGQPTAGRRRQRDVDRALLAGLLGPPPEGVPDGWYSDPELAAVGGLSESESSDEEDAAERVQRLLGVMGLPSSEGRRFMHDYFGTVTMEMIASHILQI